MRSSPVRFPDLDTDTSQVVSPSGRRIFRDEAVGDDEAVDDEEERC